MGFGAVGKGVRVVRKMEGRAAAKEGGGGGSEGASAAKGVLDVE